MGQREEDAALVEGMIGGDRAALAHLYDRYSAAALALGMRILSDRREAEDVVHDTFVEAWCQAHTYDAGRGSVRTWLLVRTRSRALDRLRSAGRARTVPLEARPEIPTPGGEDPALATDRRLVLEAMRALPAEQRTALELGYFEGLSSAEISARVDVPVGTVKSRVAAALAKLRAQLRPAPGEVVS